RGKKRRKRRRSKAETEVDVQPINDPLPFISFIAEHRIGTEVEGEVESFSSHGLYVTAAGARCYVPLTGLADPTPRSARDVVRKGETYSWVVKSFDSPRRGIELALAGSPAAGGVTPGNGAVEAALPVPEGAPVKGPRGGAGKKPAAVAPATPAKGTRAATSPAV